MIDVADENMPGYLLLLKVALQAKRRVAFIQQTLVDRAVRRMANSTTLPQCLVLIHEGAALLRVTLEAGFVFTQKSESAGFKLLLNVRRRPFHRDPFVHLVAIGAAHFAFEHRMVMRQRECRANFQVTLETGFRRLPWIDNRAGAPAGFDVQTSGPVARLAAQVRGRL